MVVVYSGESPESSSWDANVPSERPTFAHFAPVPREILENAAPSDSGNAAREPDAAAARARAASTSPPRLGSSGKKRKLPLVVFAGLGLSLIGLALVPQGLEKAPASEPSARSERVERVAAQPTAPSVAEERPQLPPEPTPAPSATEAAAAPQPEPTRPGQVTLEVSPPDAKVFRRNVRQAGPPYILDVPTGKRLTVEVAKRGFISRKVVLDGNEAHVSVTLKPKPTRAEKKEHARAEKKEPEPADAPAAEAPPEN